LFRFTRRVRHSGLAPPPLSLWKSTRFRPQGHQFGTPSGKCGIGAPCQQDATAFPQQGQTPSGRLSDVKQTVNWQVDPATYGGATTFDITVTWQVNMAVSQALFWNGQFCDKESGQCGGPTGGCNPFGCNCSYPFSSFPDPHSLTFKVPIPSGSNCPSG
jgi:hypothetical protein